MTPGVLAAVALLALAGCQGLPSQAPSPVLSGRITSKDGPLPHVFVFIREGLEGRRFEVPPEPVLLDQRGFEFTPRVFGIRAGQTLRITSSDFSPHNVHCQPLENAGFNVGLLQDESITRVLTKPEIMVPFTCNLHPTMRAYAGVVEHPWFTVTGFDGTFALPPLPPGAYTLGIWDEWLGGKRIRVDLPLRAPLEIRF